MNSKNIIIALIVSFLIILGWPFLVKTFFPQTYNQAYSKKPAKVLQEIPREAKQASPFQKEIRDQVQDDMRGEFPSEQAIPLQKQETITLKNDFLEIFLSNRGANIKQINLLKYKDKEGKLEQLISQENIHTGIFNLTTPIDTSNMLFSINKPGPNTVELSTKINNLFLTKTYSLKNNYILDLKINLKNESNEKISLVEGYKVLLSAGIGKFKKKEARFRGSGILLNTEKKQIKIYKKNKPEILYQDAFWLGQYGKYFCILVKPKTHIENIYLEPKLTQPLLSFKRKGFSLAPRESISDTYITYIGPKDISILKNQGYAFEKIINFGFFNSIGQIMLWLLNFFYKMIKNYGIAIILLTIVIKIILYPLTHKSFKSMKEMQKVSPLLQKIKEQYKKDPQRIQKETIALYKKHKVNPLGGCLPLLLQMPIFFALFAVLSNAIELRQSPFMFWIKDLSQKDPTYILPIIMGASMILQQKLSKTTMDPAQEKMMLLMPIFFTFLFINFPSGLVLYWLVNNILTIGQHVIINKRTAPAEA